MRAQTLGAAVAPPAGGAGVVWGEPADATEVTGRQRGGRGRRWQVVGFRLLRQVLPIREQGRGQLKSANKGEGKQYRGVTHLFLQQGGEVLPETLLEVVAPRLPLLLLWMLKKLKNLIFSKRREQRVYWFDFGVHRVSPGSSVSLKAGRRAVGPGGGREDRGSSWKQRITIMWLFLENIVLFLLVESSDVLISEGMNT